MNFDAVDWKLVARVKLSPDMLVDAGASNWRMHIIRVGSPWHLAGDRDVVVGSGVGSSSKLFVMPDWGYKNGVLRDEYDLYKTLYTEMDAARSLLPIPPANGPAVRMSAEVPHADENMDFCLLYAVIGEAPNPLNGFGHYAYPPSGISHGTKMVVADMSPSAGRYKYGSDDWHDLGGGYYNASYPMWDENDQYQNFLHPPCINLSYTAYEQNAGDFVHAYFASNPVFEFWVQRPAASKFWTNFRQSKEIV